MPRVYVTDYFLETSIESEVLGSDVTIEKSKEVQVLLVWHEQIDANYLDQFPNLIGVQRYGVGYDTLDIDEIKKRGLVVCNNPDYGTDEVSDTALAMIMNITRGIVRYNQLSKGLFDDWQENVIRGIKRSSNTTVGIIGAGRIGGSLALKCKAIGFNVLIYDKYKERGYEKMLGVKRVESLDELIINSDVVSINTPLTSETRAMVDEDFVSKMPKGSSLVLTARGAILKNLDIIYGALKSDHLASVALDVLPDEPPGPCMLINDWRSSAPWLNDRLLINNHSSYFSEQSYHEIRYKAALNAKRMLDSDTVFNQL